LTGAARPCSPARAASLAASGATVPLLAVTDHAAERWLQRVRGSLDPRAEIVARVGAAWAAGRLEAGENATVRVRDSQRPALVFVCRHDVPRGEALVVTLWEEGEDAAVPRKFTDDLDRSARRRR
jgi:hypothetical protein